MQVLKSLDKKMGLVWRTTKKTVSLSRSLGKGPDALSRVMNNAALTEWRFLAPRTH